MGAILAKLDLTGTGYCASLNFRRTARAVTRMYDTAMQESGVRSTQFAMLVAIAKIQPVAMGTLAEVLTIDRTTLTRSLQAAAKGTHDHHLQAVGDAPALPGVDAGR